jgi:hypothetical protein
MSEARKQINSAVSDEVYSYIKSEKAKRKCSEKQILDEMYESHIKRGPEVLAHMMMLLQEIHALLVESRLPVEGVLEEQMSDHSEAPPVLSTPPRDPFAHTREETFRQADEQRLANKAAVTQPKRSRWQKWLGRHG